MDSEGNNQTYPQYIIGQVGKDPFTRILINKLVLDTILILQCNFKYNMICTIIFPESVTCLLAGFLSTDRILFWCPIRSSKFNSVSVRPKCIPAYNVCAQFRKDYRKLFIESISMPTSKQIYLTNCQVRNTFLFDRNYYDTSVVVKCYFL